MDKGEWRLEIYKRRIKPIIPPMACLALSELPTLFPHVVAWIEGVERQAKESGTRSVSPPR
jgi:hypothetical protein